MDDDRTGQSHLSKVGDYFDEHAEFWSDLYEKPDSDIDLILANRTRLAVDFVDDNVPDGGVVLDAGCGAGVASMALALKGYSIQGLDIAADLLRHAEERLRKSDVPDDRWQFTHADLVGAELADESFDAIVALGFIQYQPIESQAMETFHRILKPGGKLVITGPTKHRMSRWLDIEHHVKTIKRSLSRQSGSKRSAEHERVLEISPHFYSPGRFRRLLTESGFTVHRWVGHGFGDYDRYISKMSKFLPISGWANDLVFFAEKRS